MAHAPGSQNFSDVDLALDPLDLGIQISVGTVQQIGAEGVVGDGHFQTFALGAELPGVFLPGGAVMGNDIHKFNGIEPHFLCLGNTAKLGNGAVVHQCGKAI